MTSPRLAILMTVVLAVAAARARAEPPIDEPCPAPPRLTTDADDGSVLPPMPISACDRARLASIQRYRAEVLDPDDDGWIEATFAAAAILGRYRHYERAIPMFVQLVERHPQHEFAYYAANQLLNALILTRQYDGLVTRAAWFHDRPEFLTACAGQDRSDLADRVAEIYNRVPRHEVMTPESFIPRADEYREVVRQTLAANPAAGVADRLDEVLYDAAWYYEYGGALTEAISTLEEVRERFPRSASAAKALARLGMLYARIGAYREAAMRFEAYARGYPRQDDAYKAMHDAIYYRTGLGDHDQALADTRYFIRAFGRKRPTDAAILFFTRASIYEQRAGLVWP